jgi:prevent-host-death family protein
MDIFTVRDLRERTGTLIRDAEEGKLSVVTKRGTPVFLALPFNEDLVKWGVNTALALNLYKEGTVSLEKASHLAGMSTEAFIEKLDMLDIAVIDYPPRELKQELSHFD